MPAEGKLTEEKQAQLKRRAMGSLYVFVKGVLCFDWLDPIVHRPLCRLLENPENTRLKITLPRGWLKSTICSIGYPLWRAVNDANVRILIVQNTFTNASKKLDQIGNIVKGCEMFQLLWPELMPDDSCKWNAEAKCLKRTKSFAESTFEAAGTGTKVTSRHYDCIIEDDTVAPDLDEMTSMNVTPSQEDIEQAIGWHRLAPPLLNQPDKSQIVIVGTRWYERDLSSWIDENEPYYKKYERACREDESGSPSSTGSITYPGRFNQQVLEELETTMGPYLFSCLYMNLPVRSEAMLFKPEWFKWYDVVPENLAIYTTVDPAGDPDLAKGRPPDYNVVMTTGKHLTSGHIYVLDYFRERCNPGELVSAIFEHVLKWMPLKVGLEAIAYQRSLQYWIAEKQRSLSTFFTVEALRASRTSKVERVRGLQPLFSSGTVMMQTWMTDLKAELEAFPLAANDDLPDALSMQLDLWALTHTHEEEKEMEFGPDPLSFDWAVRSIYGQKMGRAHFLDDIVQTKLRTLEHVQ